MFIAEAIPTVLVGFIFFFFVTDRPHQAYWLSDDQRSWLAATLEAKRKVSLWQVSSFNHPVGEQLQGVGHGEAEGCCGFEINDKLVSERELNRQIAWACAPQDPINVSRCRSYESRAD